MNQEFHMPKVPLVGIHQIGFDGAETPEEITSRTTQMIARSLNVRGTIAFVGSGISSAYGHDNWGTYATRLVKYTLKKLNGKISREHARTLETYVAGKTTHGGRPKTLLRRSDQTLLVLNLCDELFAAQGADQHEAYRSHTASMINAENEYKRNKLDPLRLIIEKLDIRRFLTTNYDCQIENALKRILGCQIISNHKACANEEDENHGGAVKPIARSLVYHAGNVEDLTQFAVAAPGYEWGVFHLHGVCGDRESMVITERDYQRVYLQEDRDHRAFRDALQVAFAGNAILFMGTGMEESDLLRPLRQFVSETTRGGYERPLFALLPNTCPNEADEFRQYLYSRYNVKTLYYQVNPNERDYTESFCKAVEKLGSCWSQWWQGWQEKPAVRKPKFFSPVTDRACVIRHLTEPGLPFNVANDRTRVSQAFAKGAGAVLVLGRQGSGKGMLGQRLVNNGTKNKRFAKRFFATAHFSNDFLCIIDAAADFFGEHNDGLAAGDGPSSLARFEKALNAAPNLFVIGGLERLLVPTSLERAIEIEKSKIFEYPLLVGEALTPEIKQFFAFVNQQAKKAKEDPKAYPGRIVLTSSVWPESLDIPGEATVWLRGVTEATILKKREFLSLKENKMVRELHRVLRGHAYALAVVRSALKLLQARRVSRIARKEWLNQMIDRLTPVDLDGRGPKAIAIATRMILGLAPLEIKNHLDSILQKVALFSTPVTPLAVQACYPPAGKPSRRIVEKALEYLQANNLLIRVHYEHKPFRTTAHTLVRNLVLKRMGSLPTAPGEAHRFEVGGWSSEVPDTFSGAGEGHKLIIDSIDSSLSHLESADKIKQEHRRDLIRAVFGLIRSRCAATAIPRLSVLEPEPTLRMPRPHYDAYQRRLSRLLNAIRATEGVDNWKAPNAERAVVEQELGALYADELAWLYNELGLVAFSTGFMPDAYALFRSGQHVNAVVERGSQGYRWCESEINLGLVQMERGHLVRARYHLENAVRASAKLDVLTLKDGAVGSILKDGAVAATSTNGATDATLKTRAAGPTLYARAVGHLGLIHHLTGSYGRSKELYDSAIKQLLEAGNRRGASIFLKHRGDLFRRMGKFKEAAEDLQGSVAAAESGSHPDLVHYATIARANLARAEDKLVRIEELVPAIDFARRVGIPKLEWDAKIVQGQIALEQGEFEMAGRLAVSTLGIASSLGLRLRLTGSLILLGRVTDALGHSAGAKKLFHSATQLAERQGNQLLIEKAAEALRASNGATRHSVFWKPLARQPVGS